MNNYNFELANIANQLANLVQIVNEPNSIEDNLIELIDEVRTLNVNILYLAEVIQKGFTQCGKTVEK